MKNCFLFTQSLLVYLLTFMQNAAAAPVRETIRNVMDQDWLGIAYKRYYLSSLPMANSPG
jgi:hypothetical protein